MKRKRKINKRTRQKRVFLFRFEVMNAFISAAQFGCSIRGGERKEEAASAWVLRPPPARLSGPPSRDLSVQIPSPPVWNFSSFPPV
jgi:hypothetical protein